VIRIIFFIYNIFYVSKMTTCATFANILTSNSDTHFLESILINSQIQYA